MEPAAFLQEKCWLKCGVRDGRAATRKHTMAGQKYFRGANIRLEGPNYAEYNKINNNSENFRGARMALPPSPLSCGPG